MSASRKPWRLSQAIGAAAIVFALAGLGLRFIVLDRGRPFWMDESFSAALAVQSPAMIGNVCRKDVHPPLYFLTLKLWNAMLAPASKPARWRLLDFEVGNIETMGLFEWEASNGEHRKTPGVFLKEPILWNEMPLAPIAGLRCLSVLFGAGAAFLLWRFARRMARERPALALAAFTIFALSGYTLTWDTVIRSYSAGACLVLAVALAGFRGADTERWLWNGTLVAVLTTLAFVMNYVVILALPGVALAIWIRAGLSRRAFLRIALSFLAGGGLTFALWGRAFLAQTGKVPSAGWFAVPLETAFGESLDTVLLHYWRMLFGNGVWSWLAGDPQATLDPLRSLTPENPILYVVAFALYASAFAVNLWDFTKRPDRTLAALTALAFLPGLIVVLGNTFNSGSFRIHARHLYPAAPFFYLFLARGWVVGVERLRKRRQSGRLRHQWTIFFKK